MIRDELLVILEVKPKEGFGSNREVAKWNREVAKALEAPQNDPRELDQLKVFAAQFALPFTLDAIFRSVEADGALSLAPGMIDNDVQALGHSDRRIVPLTLASTGNSDCGTRGSAYS
jgi:hypothetical protein